MKLSVIYFSKTGTTKRCADFILEGIRKEGVEAKAFSIDKVDEEFVKKSQGVIFGCPTYAATMPAEFHMYLEKQTNCLALSGKLVGAFATQQYIHGGADITIESILKILLVKGAMIYSGGVAFGKPVIHLGPVAMSSMDIEDFHDLFVLYGNRFLTQAQRIGK